MECLFEVAAALSVTFINIYSVSIAQFARYLGIVRTRVSFAVAE